METEEFREWNETYFEVVKTIIAERNKISSPRAIMEIAFADGHPSLVDLAIKLTKEFVDLNKDREWDGEFYDEVEEFVLDKLK